MNQPPPPPPRAMAEGAQQQQQQQQAMLAQQQAMTPQQHGQHGQHAHAEATPGYVLQSNPTFMAQPMSGVQGMPFDATGAAAQYASQSQYARMVHAQRQELQENEMRLQDQRRILQEGQSFMEGQRTFIAQTEAQWRQREAEAAQWEARRAEAARQPAPPPPPPPRQATETASFGSPFVRAPEGFVPRTKLEPAPPYDGVVTPKDDTTTVRKYDFDVRMWMVLNQEALRNLSQEHVVVWLGYALKGAAAQWYRHLVETYAAGGGPHTLPESIRTVAGYLRAIAERFEDRVAADQAQLSIQQLVMGKGVGAADAYVRRFNELAARLNNPPDSILMGFFKAGLTIGARNAVVSNAFVLTQMGMTPTLGSMQQCLLYTEGNKMPATHSGPTPMEIHVMGANQALEEEEEEELELHYGGLGGRGNTGGRGGRGGQGGRGGRGYQGGRGEWFESEKQKLRRQRYANGECLKCGATDHLKKDCPKAAGNGQGAQNQPA